MTEETKEPTKKVETPEEIARRRELSRKRVARHRLKVRLAKSGGLLPSFWEYMDQMPKSHIEALDTYVRRISRQIATELPSLIRAAHPSDWAWRDGPPALREPEEEIVSYVAPIALRLEKGYGC